MIVGGVESPCRVLDVSSTGARLTISSVRVPQTFNLRFHGQVYGCALAWQREFEIGVTLGPAHKEVAKPAAAPEAKAKIDIQSLRSQLFGQRR
jgi:hypothetical protein